MDSVNGFCNGALTAYPIDSFIPGLPTNEIGMVMAITGLLNILVSLATIIWIKRKEWEAKQEGGNGEDAAKSVIFPVFVIVVWGNVFANIYAGVIVAIVPLQPVGNNIFSYAALYASQTAFHHVVTEGIAFLLMQKGCGYHAGKEAGKLAALWGVITFFVMFFIYHENSSGADAVNLVWEAIVATFYGLLWLAPQAKLYRRPALISFSKFWFLYRLCATFINLLLISPETVGLGNCSYIVVQIVFYSLCQPLVCYWALLQDSRWWQGLDIGDQSGRARAPSYEKVRSPLVGSDFSLTTAQSLAATMDQIRVHGHVKMLNFACIKIDFSKPLGSGSFSKVCRGSYRGKECAIKLIYTVDLTADVIRRVAAEASILSSIRHPNIVHIYGVSVLPPSVCLILEICSFGSLSDVIRGYGFDWSSNSRAPLSLAYADVLHLAVGCARGLAAVHAYDRYLCHRDVKSFNFLVDHQFNVKIADLELGVRDKDDKSRHRRRKKGSGAVRGGRFENRTIGNWRSWLSLKSTSSTNNRTERNNDHHEHQESYPQQLDDDNLTADNLSHRKPGDGPGNGEISTEQDDDMSVDASRSSGRSIGSYSSHISRQHLDAKDNNLVDELLANWMAPEVITQRKFQQASDVYALGTVMWEILAKKLPFEKVETQREIRQLIISGYRHPIPIEAQDSPLAYIIQQCWEMNPEHRPKAIDVVHFLEKILHEDVFRSRIPEGFIANAPDFTTMMNYYEACYRKATVSDVQSQLRLHVPSVDRSKGFFSRFWGIFASDNGRNRHRSHQSSTSKSISISHVSTGEAPSSSQKILMKLNPTSHHFEEDDDVDFAFNLPSYSVRGSELNSTATALSVAADIRTAMKGRRSDQRRTASRSASRNDARLKSFTGAKKQLVITGDDRTYSTDAVAADKIDADMTLPQKKIGGISQLFQSQQQQQRSKTITKTIQEVDLEANTTGSMFSHSRSNGSGTVDSDATKSNPVPDDMDDAVIGDEDNSYEDYRQESNEGYMSSLARMAMPMPPAALEAVRMVKNESFWYELEASKEAWAVITPKAPYIVVHGTKAWFQRFSMVTTTPAAGFSAADAPMLSLLALLAPEIEAMPQQTQTTSTYVKLAASQHPTDNTDGTGNSSGGGDGGGMVDKNNGFRKMRSASAKEILKALHRQEEYHGVLSLHLPNVQGASQNRSLMGQSSGSVASSNRHKSGESGLTTLSRTYSSHLGNASVAVDATGRLTGVNTMFSVHIYPVHYNRAMAMSNSDSIDSTAAYNLSNNVSGAPFTSTNAGGVLLEEPLILPPLHETKTPDPPNLLSIAQSPHSNGRGTSPVTADNYMPTSPIPIPGAVSGELASARPFSLTQHQAMLAGTPHSMSSPTAGRSISQRGRINSYIDDYRSRRSSGNIMSSSFAPSIGAIQADDVNKAYNAAIANNADVLSFSAPNTANTMSSSLPRPGIFNTFSSKNNDTTVSGNRPSLFSPSRNASTNVNKSKNIDNDRQLVYFAVLFHELREQSEQFLHLSTHRGSAHQRTHSTATSTFTGMFSSRPNANRNPMHDPDHSNNTRDDGENNNDDDSLSEADAAHTMSRTYSRNTGGNAFGYGMFRPEDIIHEASEESSRQVSLADEEAEFVRRYREENSVASSRQESVNEPAVTASSSFVSQSYLHENMQPQKEKGGPEKGHFGTASKLHDLEDAL